MKDELRKQLQKTDPERLQTLLAFESVVKGDPDAMQKMQEAQAATTKRMQRSFNAFASDVALIKPRI